MLEIPGPGRLFAGDDVGDRTDVIGEGLRRSLDFAVIQGRQDGLGCDGCRPAECVDPALLGIRGRYDSVTRACRSEGDRLAKRLLPQDRSEVFRDPFQIDGAAAELEGTPSRRSKSRPPLGWPRCHKVLA